MPVLPGLQVTLDQMASAPRAATTSTVAEGRAGAHVDLVAWPRQFHGSQGLAVLIPAEAADHHRQIVAALGQVHGISPVPRRMSAGVLALVSATIAAAIAVAVAGSAVASPRDVDTDGIRVGATGTAAAVRGVRNQEAPDPSVAGAVPFDVGRSAGGRMITGFHRRGSDAASRTVLVIGVIHGDELGGLAVTQLLSTIALPTDLDLWVVPVMDVDGVATSRHGNGAGIDLNRNWPVDWVAPGVVDETSGVKNSGPSPGSEPETKEMMALIQTIRPKVTVWYHEPFDTVDCNVVRVGPVCSEFAAAIGYEVTLRDRPGTATDWIMTSGYGVSFVVELPDGGVDPAAAAVQAGALLKLH